MVTATSDGFAEYFGGREKDPITLDSALLYAATASEIGRDFRTRRQPILHHLCTVLERRSYCG